MSDFFSDKSWLRIGHPYNFVINFTRLESFELHKKAANVQQPL